MFPAACGHGDLSFQSMSYISQKMKQIKGMDALSKSCVSALAIILLKDSSFNPQDSAADIDPRAGLHICTHDHFPLRSTNAVFRL